MTNRMKAITLVLAGLTMTALPSQAAVVFRTGVFVGPVYHPWGYGPYWGYPGPYSRTVYRAPSHAHSGQLKIDTAEKKSSVYIDGAYAGTVKEVDSAWLPEGKHAVEVRSANGQVFDQDVQLIAGKTLHLKPVMPVDAKKG